MSLLLISRRAGKDTFLASAVLIFALFKVTAATAQTLTQGALSGVIRSADGAPVPEALVILRDRATKRTVSVPISSGGDFNLRFVEPGEYDLTVEAFGARPLRLEAIPVRSGTLTRVEAQVTRSTEATPPLEVRVFSSAGGVGSEHISAADLARFPHHGRELAFITRLSSSVTHELETEGLNGSFSAVRINGAPVTVAPHLGLVGPAISFPLSAFVQAELVNASADVERSGAATAELSAQMIRGSPQLEARGFGAWEHGAAVRGTLASPVFSGFEGGALLSGPLDGNAASFVVGFELWRTKTPFGFGPQFDSAVSRLTRTVEQNVDRNIASAVPRHLSTADAFSGFGRIDWQLSAAHNLSVHALVGSQPEAQRRPAAFDGVAAHAQLEVVDAAAGATLASQLGQNIAQELRLGFDRVERTAADFDSIAHTTLVNDAMSAGPQLLRGARYASSTVRLGEALHLWAPNHHAKLGLTADLGSYDVAAGLGRESRFWLSVPEDLGIGNGYVVTATARTAVSFRHTRLGLFVQDEWSPAERFRLLLGVRYDLDLPPADDVRRNAEWFNLSGIRSDSALARHARVSPRVELEWQPDAARRWSLRGWGGVWSAPIDPSLIGELISNDGRAQAHRDFLSVQAWPDAIVFDTAPTLTVLPNGFRGPRSTRAGVELTSAPARGLVIHLGGTYRRTERLLRAANLNLPPVPSVHDQHDRPVFGILQQEGSILAPAADTNRRFQEFAQVTALSPDGWSEYRAVSGGVQVDLAGRLLLHGRYTYSKTEDNWFMARGGVSADALSPFPTDSGVDWREGRSDFDVPHRVFIGAELSNQFLGGTRLAMVYRYRSGYPFTPGFRDGVDANGDGSLRNDPAFVDESATGFAVVAANNSCLSGQAGRFAARNSCREAAASAIDARLSIAFLGRGQRRAEVVLDVLNLFQSGGEQVDRALFVLAPGGGLFTDPGSGTITIPWLLNPNFGAPLIRAGGALTVRVGLRVNY